MNASSVGHAYLHAEYCERTESKIPFTDEVHTSWWQWLAWRSPFAFTMTDLCLVIAWLNHEIRGNRRHPSCLEFSNLIGNPELFEQHLGLAQRWGRLRRLRAEGVARERWNNSNARTHG
ncbi:hypothetical protein DES53_1031 [Roseimicrobium gellanilyticum]|uniref:Uncharacterized protein n=1 Tax=Roseimicrobium gellanilyticum TaxID=748857 RepID=A0A366HND6_9BACT|nr:hypothetical protein [Roseimicrobium gellanilyticum]RBP45006.1 hypothetical protein DES53_1031 [Roseimicrobium gellanilyticum]